MTVKQFPLPDLGEGLTEGEILKWLVQVGDTVTQNQPIVEVETAKAAVEIPAKWAGLVTEIHHPEGATVEVGSPMISIETEPGAASAGPSAASLAAVEMAPSEGATEPGLIGGPAPGGRTAVLVGYGPRSGAAVRRPRRDAAAPASVAAAPPAAAPPAAAPAERVLAKPPVRKLARDLGVDLSTLDGTGPSGSVTRSDVEAAANGGTVAAPTPAPVGREQRIPVKGVRKLIAENTVASAFTAPHVTEFLTIDMTRSMRVLDRLRERPEFHDVRMSPLLLVARACLGAIRRHPMVNSTWSGDEIVIKQYVNLGIAAATERGLIVPNIKDADQLSLRQLADALTDLVGTARSGRTTPADMSGGTFTITNVGVFGVDTGTPILPTGEAAILAFGAVREAPWVHHGKIKIRRVSTLSLSFDHRIVDGELGSRFLRDVGAFLTDPESTMLAWS